MEESAKILKKYFETLYDKAEIEWTDENDKDMEKLSEILREEANECRKGDQVIMQQTNEGSTVLVKYCGKTA